jgi:GTP pyrophosphokinase
MLAKLRLDQTSITAGLLHDVLETGKVTLDQLGEKFGDEVALIVDGVTEMRKKTAGTRDIQDPVVMENLRRLIFASVSDVRILIIRLIEKFHGALTIEYLPKKDQLHQAEKILRIYVPLAEYSGFYFLKREMEDISFKILHPKEYQKIFNFFEENKILYEKEIESLVKQLKRTLDLNRVPYEKIFGRRKGIYSTYLKIKRYLEEGKINQFDPGKIHDVLGITILAKDVPACYAALGLVQSSFDFIPEKFDDYISRPKPTGYRAIQTTIKLTNQIQAEIQIKTPAMHYYNEFGPASHIAYKIKTNKLAKPEADFSWVEKLSGWQDGKFKIKVFEDYIYVFTPKRDIIQLKAGSTPIDFAARIHGDLLRFCSGAKVNGKMVKLNHPLKNGDLVELLKSKKPIGPNRDWLYWCQMRSTKAMIRKKLK